MFAAPWSARHWLTKARSAAARPRFDAGPETSSAHRDAYSLLDDAESIGVEGIVEEKPKSIEALVASPTFFGGRVAQEPRSMLLSLKPSEDQLVVIALWYLEEVPCCKLECECGF